MCRLIPFPAAATTEIYTLSLHERSSDLPDIMKGREDQGSDDGGHDARDERPPAQDFFRGPREQSQDRKSTRLNSSHRCISYAVFCLKKKSRASPPSSTRAGTSAHQTICE